MNSDDYGAKLEQLRDISSANLIALGQWVQAEALSWLWGELGGAILTPRPHHPMARTPPTQPILRPMTEREAVRQGLIASLADRRKLREPSFYQAQLTMLDAEARRYCASIESFAKQQTMVYADAALHTLHRALLEMMCVATVLLEDAARAITDLSGYFGAWRRRREHPFEVFKGAEQIIYGTYSGMTHADRAPYIPVAVLRTAIELRLRHAFGVYSLRDPKNPDVPVFSAFSALFRAIQAQQDEIAFAVDINDVWQIYRWSNFYLHSGMRDYPWVPGFLLQHLRPIFADQEIAQNGSWSVNGGIRMRRQTWRSVREALLEPSRGPRLTGRLVIAWRALVGKSRRLELPDFHEMDAQVVFLD
jgi:hypothetical protein